MFQPFFKIIFYNNHSIISYLNWAILELITMTNFLFILNYNLDKNKITIKSFL